MNKFALLPAALIIASSSAMASDSLGHWGGSQNNFNNHIQHQVQGVEKVNDHQYRYLNGLRDDAEKMRGNISENSSRIDDVKAHANRNTGLGEANQRRLNAKDELDQRQNDSVNNAHARIGGVIEQADKDRQVLNSTTERSLGNQQAVGQLQKADEGLSKAIQSEQKAREGVDSRSIQRDESIVSQVNYNEQVNAVYRQSTAEQFQQHGSAIAANSQAIAKEADRRKAGDEELKAGVAMAVAAGSHHFDTNYRGMQLSLSGGFYEGASAQSLAAGGALTENVFGSVSVSNDSKGNQAVGVNTTWKF